jgi:glycerophosphoryl diester phosphodiesterase
VVAHRGASEVEAEHTLAAYHRAIDDGADGVECDVRLTRDGVLVCVHDRRIDRTSSGRGIVSALELADLAELDFGSWHYAGRAGDGAGEVHDGEAPDRDRSGVLTLRRLVEALVDRGDPVELAIETKHPTRYAGLVEIALVELLARFGLDRPDADSPVRPRVMSFAASSLRRLRGMAPALPTVFLMDRVPLRYRDGSLPHPADAAGPAVRILRAHPAYVERVHAAGGEVHVWTVDEPADVELLCKLGVDVIITNRPGQVLAQLAELAPR